MGTQLPHIKGHSSPSHFLVHVYCGQTAGWIRIPLGAKVGRGPCDIVLDLDPSPQRKGAQQPPLFDPSLYYCGQTVAHLSNCWALVNVAALSAFSTSCVVQNVSESLCWLLWRLPSSVAISEVNLVNCGNTSESLLIIFNIPVSLGSLTRITVERYSYVINFLGNLSLKEL